MTHRLLFISCLLFLLAACDGTIQEEEEIQNDTPAGINEQLLSGWNTWHNPSILSHVLMPQGLKVQFKLRKKRGGPRWLDGAYVANPKYNFPEKIRPLEHAYDGSYTALELEWEGVKAKIESATEGDDLFLLFSPQGEQEEAHILVVETGMLWNKPGHLTPGDSVIIAEVGEYEINIRTTGDPTGYDFPLGQPHLTFDSDRETAIYTGRPRSLAEIKSAIAARKAAHHDRSEQYGELKGAYASFQSVVAWNLFYDAFNDRAISSVSRIWNESWAGYIIFDWDTYFIALLASLDNKELAYSNVFAITNAITDGGFIPNVSATFDKSNDRSQPPVGSMTVKLIYDRYGEKWFLEEVYDELLSWNRWWADHRDNQGYLSWGSHPHPEGMSPNTLKAAKWESGLDNSPLFDEAAFDTTTHLMELASAGLMGLYVADCNYLAEIAEELGKTEDARELTERADRYGAKLVELWDDDMGFYRDLDLRTGRFTNHKAPTHFYPLLAKVANQEQAERMVREHLLNPEEFFGEYMIPSISRDDPAFGDNSYWRGRIWAPMNFLVYMGLRNYDLPDATRLIAEKSKQLILGEWDTLGHIHENYNSVTGEGDDVRNSDPFYAWGGLLAYIALVEAGYVREKN